MSAKRDSKSFKSTIVKDGDRAYLIVPFDPNQVWGVKDRHHVNGSINEHGIRACIESNGPPFTVSLGPRWIRDNLVTGGEEVEVILAPEGPQTHNVSADIAAALTEQPEVRIFFDSLPTFYRNNFIRDIESAKRPETRSKRIAAMMALLKAGKRQT